MVRVFASGPGDLDSIPGQVILDSKNASLLNTQHYKVSGAISTVVAIEKGAFRSPIFFSACES